MNSEQKKPGLISDMVGLLNDQADLAALELHYETAQATRRLVALILAGLFALASFGILQLMILNILIQFRLSWLAASALLVVLDAIVAVLIFKFVGLRDPRAGRPFEGTRRESKETLQWIQKLFS